MAKPDAFVPAPGGEYMLDIAFGQSWVDDNGKPGVLSEFTYAQDAGFVMMPDDKYGADGVSYDTKPRGSFGLTSYRELDAELQTLMGPYGLRWAHDARRAGRFPGIAVASAGHGGYKLERLAPKDFAWADTKDGLTPVYDNFLTIVTAVRDALAQYGQTLCVRYVPWIHGAANAGSYARNYAGRLGMIFDRIAADVCDITGQRMSPTFLVVQSPGGARGGAWENLQAQVALAHWRNDCIFVGASWHVEQHDGLHYSNNGVLHVAEMLAIAARADTEGQEWIAPTILPETVRREGTRITGQFSVPVVNDVSNKTPRHYLPDLGEPVPHFGFEYSTSAIKRARLNGQRQFEIELEEDVAGRLAFAWHAKDRRADPENDPVQNQSVNRGTLRAVRRYRSIFFDEPISFFVASFFKNL